MEADGRNISIDHNDTEIFDIAVNRVAEEQPLSSRGKLIHGVKHSRKICQKGQKHIIEVAGVPEENKQRRQNQANSDIKNQQAQHWIKQHQHMGPKGDAVKGAEEEVHAKSQEEIDQSRYVFTQQEQVLRDIDFGENARIAHQTVHAAFGGLLKVGDHQITTEQIRYIMGRIPSKKSFKNDRHYKQCQQRRENTPSHSQDCAFILLFEIAFDQFLK